MTNIIENPCGKGLPAFPRLLSIPCAASYLSRSTGFVEARLRDGTFEYHIDGAQDRVIDREFLDRWITLQKPATGKLREPKQATAARVGAAS
jgi:hypothetical protein